MDGEAVRDATAAGRHRFADLVDSLAESRLGTSSLCAGWSVRVVAGHPATCGRTAVLERLDGPGVAVLAERIGGPVTR